MTTPYEQAYEQLVGPPRRSVRRTPSHGFTAVLDALAYLGRGHNYRIAQMAAVTQQDVGRHLDRMRSLGLVESAGMEVVSSRTRVYYQLTTAGRRLAALRHEEVA